MHVFYLHKVILYCCRHIVSITTSTSSNNLTWLQRQQQKLRERKEVQMRTERYPQENRLISELRNIQQHSYTRVLRPSASHRADGYTSDTTHFADDDDDQEDFTIPLHINTTTTSPTHKLNSVGSAPASPLLPNRTSSRRYYGNSSVTSHQSSSTSYLSSAPGTSPLGRQRSDSSFDRERPFVAVKRAHEQTRKFKDTQVSDTFILYCLHVKFHLPVFVTVFCISLGRVKFTLILTVIYLYKVV